RDIASPEVECVAYFFFQAEDGIRDRNVTGVQTCALPILRLRREGHINGQEVPEIILLNSHDGSSSYQMIPGIFRFVCTNGLVCRSEERRVGKERRSRLRQWNENDKDI